MRKKVCSDSVTVMETEVDFATYYKALFIIRHNLL